LLGIDVCQSTYLSLATRSQPRTGLLDLEAELFEEALDRQIPRVSQTAKRLSCRGGKPWSQTYPITSGIGLDAAVKPAALGENVGHYRAIRGREVAERSGGR
jgi:hypothetical protein